MADAAKPGDARFHRRAGPHSLGAIAALLGAETTKPALLIHGIAPLQTAGPEDISFLDNRRYASLLAETRAAAVIIHPDFVGHVPAGIQTLVTPEPYVGWARVAAMFHPFAEPRAGIHPSAIIAPSANIDPSVEIGAGTVIGAEVSIGSGSMIGALACIGDGVIIGQHCRIHAQTTISHAVLGNRVVVYPGARIGQDGFGFAISETGFTPVPQLGRVVIGDGAEIGANTAIDRGSAQDTVIGPGVRIDNLVQIGHNVSIGANSVIIAQAGISGSARIGSQVMIAGQAGLAGHIAIGDMARIGAQAGVMSDVPAGEQVLGSPAQPSKAFFREVVTLRKLAQTGRTPKKPGG